MRLIDADKDWKIEGNGNQRYALEYRNGIFILIDTNMNAVICEFRPDMPTAYDLDKVMELLKEARFPITDLKVGVKVNGRQQTDDAVLYDRALAIMRAGVIEEISVLNMDNLTLGQRISYYRTKKGYSPKELAEKLNITPQNMLRLEKDGFNPTASTLQKIMDALQITPNQLFGEGWERKIFQRSKRSCGVLKEIIKEQCGLM